MACIHLTKETKENFDLYTCTIKHKKFPQNYRLIAEAYKRLYTGCIAPPNHDCPFAYRGLEVCANCPLYEKRP